MRIQHKETLLNEQDIATIYHIFSKANITDSVIREEHKRALKADSSAVGNGRNCLICQKPVSEKVQAFCLANKKFKGNIYCFEHQKTVD